MRKVLFLLSVLIMSLSSAGCGLWQNSENEELLEKLSDLEEQLEENVLVEDSIEISGITVWKYILNSDGIFCRDCQYPGDSHMKDADSSTFKILDKWFYAKDKNNAYWLDVKIDDVNIASFTDLTENYAKDDFSVFFHSDTIIWAEPNSIVIKSQYIAEDNLNLYLCWKEVADKQIEKEIISVTGPIFKTKNLIIFSNCEYWDVAIFDSWDPDSFESLWNWYSKDKTNVYIIDAWIIKDADSASFKIVEDNNLYNAEDKNNKYLFGRIVQ